MNRDALIPAVITTLFWSSAFAGIRAGLTAYTPLHLTLLRFGVASIAFSVYALFVRMPLPRAQDVPRLFLLSLAGVTIYHTALNIGEQSVSAGAASLIIAIAPAITAILSAIVLRERMSALKCAGMLVSFTGVAVMVLASGDIAFTRGALFVLVSSVMTSLYFVYQKPMLAVYKPIHFTAYITWLGTLPLLAFSGGFGTALMRAPLSATLAGVYIGIFPAAIAYCTWSMALAKAPAGQLSSFLYLTPPLAMLFGLIWMHEVPRAAEVLGGLIALAGVVMVNAHSRHRQQAPATGPAKEAKAVPQPTSFSNAKQHQPVK